MMRTRRFYKITKTLLSYGLDDLIPAGWLPWTIRLGRHAFFWLPNKHKDKPAGVRLRLALEELGVCCLHIAKRQPCSSVHSVR